jgi:hypothetical protein
MQMLYAISGLPVTDIETRFERLQGVSSARGTTKATPRT